MTLKLHNVPPMPTLAMLADNGGIVTVNPDWCDWYEQVFNEPAGTGYVKGREIMNQVDQSYSELLSIRSEAMKSAIHSMISNDPNRPTVRFNSIAEAEKSFELYGKHAMDFDKTEQVFTFDGYFSVSDMEAILFIRRAEDLIDKAKERFPGFADCATASYKDLDINQLMQVMQPGLERTDIDSEIFAQPVSDAFSYAAGVMTENMKPIHQKLAERSSPMAERFNSVVEAHATLAESGILQQNVSPAVKGSFHMDGYFTPKDLEALLYLYRNNDPMIFPAKDANGLPKDNLLGGPRSIWNSRSGKPHPEGYNITVPELLEGDEFDRTHITSDGRVLHIAYTRDGDQAFYSCTARGNLVMRQSEPKGTRGGLRRGEFHAISAVTSADKSLLTPDDFPRILLDITGQPVPKYLVTDLPGDRFVEKDLSVLINMGQEEFNELGYRITAALGTGTLPEEDEQLKGITHRDYLKVAIMRLKGEI